MVEVKSANPNIHEYIEGDILEEAPHRLLLEKLYVWEKVEDGPFSLASPMLEPTEGKDYVVVVDIPGGAEATFFGDESTAREFFGDRDVVFLQRDFAEGGKQFP